MKLGDIKSLTDKELESKLIELKTELFNLRFSHATGNLQNSAQLHNVKKDIARVKTILAERKVAQNGTKA